MIDLLKLMDTDDFYEDGWMRLKNSSWKENSLELLFDVNAGIEGSSNSSWNVSCKDPFEYKLYEAYDCGLNHHKGDHIAILQFSTDKANLFFSGTHTEPRAVVGALYEAHSEFSQDWIDFDKYINTSMPLSELIEAGHGKLADGPKFILQEYKSVLESLNIKATLTDVSTPKRWNGTSYSEVTRTPEMIHFGGSYVVAESFSANKIT